jgi:hypothetical protein
MIMSAEYLPTGCTDDLAEHLPVQSDKVTSLEAGYRRPECRNSDCYLLHLIIRTRDTKTEAQQIPPHMQNLQSAP